MAAIAEFAAMVRDAVLRNAPHHEERGGNNVPAAPSFPNVFRDRGDQPA